MPVDQETRVRKRKKVVVSLEKKIEALERLRMGESFRSVAEDMGVGETTVRDWKTNEDKVRTYCSQFPHATRLTGRATMMKPKLATLDEALWVWFMTEKQFGVTVNGPMIKAKALELNQMMGGNQKFSASNGWLERWKKRHGICAQSASEGFMASLIEMHSGEAQEPVKQEEKMVHHELVTEVPVEYIKEEIKAEEAPEEIVSDIEGLEALEKALRYVQQQPEATHSDVMFIRRWRDLASNRIISFEANIKVEYENS